ncbi:MAG: hypothetical protein HGB33_06310 [Syntrophaceae bacterium]|nr:hypothetical protein [Syntrophaceae bacterium]
MAAASEQAASASRLVADGTSAQAASLEEVSSSLEEISSMKKQNADNATKAKSLMEEAKIIVDNVDSQMNKMFLAIQDVTKSSEETRKIIKTVNEIAFQTKLLALNAAVEAARAGDAGVGFAVVSDEVGKLAQRVANAANNTSGLIEDNIATFKQSSQIMYTTRKSFQENVVINRTICTLVDEIETASKAQSREITQVGQALADMDNVVQATAATAGESAGAAEEMRSETENMNNYVVELAAVIGGTDGKTEFKDVFPATTNNLPEKCYLGAKVFSCKK